MCTLADCRRLVNIFSDSASSRWYFCSQRKRQQVVRPINQPSFWRNCRHDCNRINYFQQGVCLFHWVSPGLFSWINKYVWRKHYRTAWEWKECSACWKGTKKLLSLSLSRAIQYKLYLFIIQCFSTELRIIFLFIKEPTWERDGKVQDTKATKTVVLSFSVFLLLSPHSHHFLLLHKPGAKSEISGIELGSSFYVQPIRSRATLICDIYIHCLHSDCAITYTIWRQWAVVLRFTWG